MTGLYPAKQQAWDWIATNRSQMWDFHMEIWNYTETAWREYRSALAFVEILCREGFSGEEGSGEMPTRFAATWGDGGPTLGTYAEYAAVPGNSQLPVPYQAHPEGLNDWAPGHIDPHSSLGTAALKRTIAARGAMERNGIRRHAEILRRACREGLRLQACPRSQGRQCSQTPGPGR